MIINIFAALAFCIASAAISIFLLNVPRYTAQCFVPRGAQIFGGYMDITWYFASYKNVRKNVLCFQNVFQYNQILCQQLLFLFSNLQYWKSYISINFQKRW